MINITESLIEQCRKPDGRLGRAMLKIKISYHMREYNTNSSLIRLLKDVGFQSVEILERNKCICVVAVK